MLRIFGTYGPAMRALFDVALFKLESLFRRAKYKPDARASELQLFDFSLTLLAETPENLLLARRACISSAISKRALTPIACVALVLSVWSANVRAQNDLIFLGDERGGPGMPYEKLAIPIPSPPQPFRKSSGSLTKVSPSSPSLRPANNQSNPAQKPARQTGPAGAATLPPPPTETNPMRQRIDNLWRQMNESDLVDQQKVRTIGSKIGRLQQIIQDKRNAAAAKQPALPNLPPAIESPNDGMQEAPLESILGDMDVVTEKSVDPMGLANNLFAIGELKLALKTYQEILASEDLELLPGNKIWVQFQIAGCHRRMGNSTQAEKVYRAVAGNKIAPYWAEQSRWWLTSMATTARIKERDTKMVNTLTRLKELTNELSQIEAK